MSSYKRNSFLFRAFQLRFPNILALIIILVHLAIFVIGLKHNRSWLSIIVLNIIFAFCYSFLFSIWAALKRHYDLNRKEKQEFSDIIFIDIENEFLNVKKKYPGFGRYALYLMLGKRHSGKSALIKNSGSFFERIKETEAIPDNNPFDWWVSENDQLIIVEVPESCVFNPDPPQKNYLDFIILLLLRYRKKNPVNGLIYVNSADNLRNVTEDNFTEVRVVIKRVIRDLGYRLPVFILINKSDLLCGFEDFFSPIKEEKNTSLLGCVFNNVNLSLASLNKEFANFFVIISAVKFFSLQQLCKSEFENHDIFYNRIRNAFLFPEELNSLKNKITNLIEKIFIYHNSKEASAFPRGVYLTSATQEGKPISYLEVDFQNKSLKNLCGNISKGRGVQQYFTHSIFSTVLQTDRKLSKFFLRRNFWWYIAVLSFLSLLTIFTFPRRNFPINDIVPPKPVCRISGKAHMYEESFNLTSQDEQFANSEEINQCLANEIFKDELLAKLKSHGYGIWINEINEEEYQPSIEIENGKLKRTKVPKSGINYAIFIKRTSND